jgi:hypothetical protein
MVFRKTIRILRTLGVSSDNLNGHLSNVSQEPYLEMPLVYSSSHMHNPVLVVSSATGAVRILVQTRPNKSDAGIKVRPSAALDSA